MPFLTWPAIFKRASTRVAGQVLFLAHPLWRVPALTVILLGTWLIVGCSLISPPSANLRVAAAQNSRAYYADRQVAACSVARPVVRCNDAARALDQWKHDEERLTGWKDEHGPYVGALERISQATPNAPVPAWTCKEWLRAIKRDRAAVRKAGVK